MSTSSIWKNTAQRPPRFPALDKEITADVVIIGAGITGLTLANLLRKSERKIVILEARDIGEGTTGYASNHLTTDIDFGYRNVKKKFSEKTMSLIAASRRAAINHIEEICTENSIECDFARRDGYLYTEEEKNITELEEEYKYADRAGLEVEEASVPDLPFKTAKAVCFRNQAIFHTQKFLNGLALSLQDDPKCQIYCHSKVERVDNANKKVFTQGGVVSAQHIILATHIPQFINILQTMVVPHRSYMLSVKLKSGQYPSGLYWDMHEPYHYTRSYHQGQESWLLVGGADHKTGHNGEDHYAQLEKYVRERYGDIQVVNKWSAQYYEPADGLPYIGKSPFSNVYVATGFSGDGLVYGIVAAMILDSLINGNEHEWLNAYDARRFTPLESAKKFVKHNTEVAKHLLTDYFKSADLKDIKPGEGKIINYEGNKYAVSRNHEGKLVAVSAICTHMGCIVHWNQQETSWDCPCHGSRFQCTGELIEGPATQDLDRQDLE